LPIGYKHINKQYGFNFFSYAKPKFVLSGTELRLVNSPVPSPEQLIRSDWIRPRIHDAANIVLEVGKRKIGVTEDEAKTITKHILDEIIRVTYEIEAEPIIVYIAPPDEISSDAQQSAGEEFMLAFCLDNAEIFCHSTRPDFLVNKNIGISLKTGGHWGPAGHRILAKSIFNFLIDEKLTGRELR